MTASKMDYTEDTEIGVRFRESKAENKNLVEQLISITSTNEEKTAVLQTILQNILRDSNLVLAENSSLKKKPVNIGSLGLLSFAMTTILLNTHNAGFFELGSAIVSTALTMGGALQFIVGILDVFNGDRFGAISFTSFGVFWISLVCIWLMPQNDPEIPVTKTTGPLMGLYLLLWGLYTACLTVVTFFTAHRLTQALFVLIFFVFLLLATAEFSGQDALRHTAAYVGLTAGVLALYLAFADILEENLGFPVLPVFHVKRN